MISLTCFEKIDVDKLLNWQLVHARILNGYSNKDYFGLVKRIAFNMSTIEYSKNDNRYSILYFYYLMNKRSDIRDMIDSVLGTIDNKYDVVTLKKKYRFNILRSFYVIKCLSIWIKEFRNSDYNHRERIKIYSLLIELLDVLKSLEKIDFSQYKLAFCFYDAEPFQNLFSQYAKLQGCKSATLQHGIMLAPRASVVNNIDFSGIEFYSFVSDYFLVWNEFTKLEAIKAGINEDRIQVLGISKCIAKPQLKNNRDSNLIGVFLDGEFEKHNNIPLITITQEWARQKSMRCVFRYHPNFNGDEYASIIDTSISEVCPKEVSLPEFVENSLFCVLANSTVLFELEYYCIPFLRYSSNDLLDKFKDYSSLCFTSLFEFDLAVKVLKNTPPREFVSCEVPYCNFFKKFM